MVIDSANKYMHKAYRSMLMNWLNLQKQYSGKEGALRMAREFGYGLAVYDEEEAEDIIKSSYGTLCVRLYNLSPPIDASEWNAEVRKAMKEAEDGKGKKL